MHACIAFDERGPPHPDADDARLPPQLEPLLEFVAIEDGSRGFIFNGGHFIQPDIPPMRLVRAYRLVNELAWKYHG